MTFLVRHKSGTYYYRKTHRLPSGKRKEVRRSLRTTNFKEAQFIALKMYFGVADDRVVVGSISDRITGEYIAAISQLKPALTSSLTLVQAVDEFLTEKVRTGFWCSKEYRRGEVMLEALIECLGKTTGIAAIGRRESNQFKQSLLASDRSITTINNYLKRASMLFEWLILRGECNENPFKGLLIKQRRAVSKLRAAYSAEDKASFLDFAFKQNEWRKWVLLLLRYTGARPSEICQLYKDDIDIDARTISIDAIREDQKLKTPNSARCIPIHSQLINDGFLEFVKSITSDRLFPVLRNLEKGGYSHTFVTWYSKQRAKLAGLPELYGARHTAATEMKNAGIPNQFASAVLGHSNNSITYDRYGKSIELDHLRDAIESIGNTPTTKGE